MAAVYHDGSAGRLQKLIDQCRPRMAEISKAFDKDDAAAVALYEEAKYIARANDMLSRERIHSK